MLPPVHAASHLPPPSLSTFPPHPPIGCGFLDTVVALVELGGDINARDITDCTPLQNAAHGTYSALASVPASPATAAAPLPPPAATATGYARLNPPHQPQLTPSQQAAQAAITASAGAAKRDGLVPVRTGLAWAPAGGGSHAAYDPLLTSAGSLWGAGGFSATLDFGPASGTALTAAAAAGGGSSSSSSNVQDLWGSAASWRGTGLSKLLRKAGIQQRRSSNSNSAAAAAGSSSQAALAPTTQQTVQAALQQMQAALARSQAVLQEQLLLQLQVPPLLPTGSGDGSAGNALLLEAGDGASGSCSNAGALVAASGGASSSAAAAQLLGGVDSSGLALAAAAAAITRPTADSTNLDCLARRTDQLSFAAGEQDRSRLIKARVGRRGCCLCAAVET